MSAWRMMRMAELDEMKQRLSPLSAHIAEHMKPMQRALCGSMPLAMLGAMIDGLNWPDTALVRDFTHGFRSVGDVPDSGVFAPGGKPMEADLDSVLAGNARYTSQVMNQTRRWSENNSDDGREVWNKTIKEVDDGLCIGPLTRNQIDKMWGYGKWRSMPRFGIWQKDKLRPIDDAKSSLHNAITRTRESLRCCERTFRFV